MLRTEPLPSSLCRFAGVCPPIIITTFWSPIHPHFWFHSPVLLLVTSRLSSQKISRRPCPTHVFKLKCIKALCPPNFSQMDLSANIFVGLLSERCHLQKFDNLVDATDRPTHLQPNLRAKFFLTWIISVCRHFWTRGYVRDCQLLLSIFCEFTHFYVIYYYILIFFIQYNNYIFIINEN